jgi:phosphoenolpyruvate synthase/pyruvate phosphate dikinase
VNRELLEKCREIIYGYAPGFEILISEIEQELEKTEEQTLTDEEIFKLNRRISELEEYIAEQGDIHDQCTYNILNKTICNGCKCRKQK